MKRSTLFVLVVIAIFATGCGPWSYNANCRSKVGDWTGCLEAGAPANAWLQKEGFIPLPAPVVNVPAPIINLTIPAQPTAAAAAPQPPSATATPQPTTASTVCTVKHDYALTRDMQEVSTHPSMWWIHVEFYANDDPESETLLAAGRYKIANGSGGLRGHVFEYGQECTREQVTAQINAHIQRRLDNKANNKGWAPQSLVDTWFQKQ